MTISELQSALYINVVCKLLEVIDEFGDNTQHIESEINGARFFKGYQRRPSDFRHNYQRDKFLMQRDKYIYAQSNNRMRVHLLTEKNRSDVTIHSAQMGFIFGPDKDKAIKLLTKMLSRMYDRVMVDERSVIDIFDASNGRGENREGFNAV
jgi:hypothetical protein